MIIVDTTLDAGVDAMTALMGFVSIHTAYSAAGANEASGGSYAREAQAFDPSSNAEAAPTGDVAVTVPAGTYKYTGLWSLVSGGTFRGMTPLGSTGIFPFVGLSADNTIYCPAHGFSDGDTVVFFGENLPTGITAGAEYTVDNATTDTFTLDSGGAVSLTVSGRGVVSKLVAEVFGSEGTITVLAASSLVSARGLLD